jgi:hypothetical protein
MQEKYSSNGIQIDVEYFEETSELLIRIFKQPITAGNVIRDTFKKNISPDMALEELKKINCEYPKDGDSSGWFGTQDERDAADAQFDEMLTDRDHDGFNDYFPGH